MVHDDDDDDDDDDERVVVMVMDGVMVMVRYVSTTVSAVFLTDPL